MICPRSYSLEEKNSGPGVGLMSALTDAFSSILDEKVTLLLFDQRHGIRTGPKNELQNQAMQSFSLKRELRSSQLQVPKMSSCVHGCQDRCRHPGPHQHSWLMVFPAQLEKGTSANLKREPVLMKSTAWLGCWEWEGKFSLTSHSLIC